MADFTIDHERLVGRLIGRLVKPLALGPKPLRRNTPTSPTLMIAEERDLAAEQKRLCALIDRFATGGPARCTGDRRRA